MAEKILFKKIVLYKKLRGNRSNVVAKKIEDDVSSSIPQLY